MRIAALRPEEASSRIVIGAGSGRYLPVRETVDHWRGGGRRATGFTRTDDFRQWPEPELVLCPDPQDEPDVSFYGTSYFRYPTNPDLHCALVEIYHQVADRNDAQIAFSYNMTHWLVLCLS